MNIALIGYGRMGHEIEEAALKRGHSIGLIVDMDNRNDLNSEKLSAIDVVIEFSFPEAALENITKCLECGVPVVSGTTGWLSDYDKAVKVCHESGSAFIHSTNYSPGVNLLFMLNRELARRIEAFAEYKVNIEEIHHTKKLDAPSGTAITIARDIISGNKRYGSWKPEEQAGEGEIPVKAIREGDVPGTHTVTWDSEIDTITLRHEAKGRKGLAFGAVVAAEFLAGKKGVYTMADVMGF